MRRADAIALLCAALAAGTLSLLFPSTPTYDPWAWLIWSREIVQGDLVTEGGPSWKPLPVLLDVPFVLAGDELAPALWLVTARAAGALALLLAFRLAMGLAGGGVPGALAGAVAALGILGMDGWLRGVALGNSEGMLIALVLAAFDRHRAGRRGQAFALGAGAALLRPEAWPFLALYGLVAGWRDPRRRARLAAAGVAVLGLWFLPEWWGSGHLLRSAERANDPLRGSIAYADRPALEVLRSTGALLVAPLLAAAAVALAVAAVAFARRRAHGAVLALAAGAAGWTGLIMAMTEAGYSGNARYLMLAAALLSVLGGIGFARLAQAIARAVERFGGSRGAATAGGVLVVAAALALCWPWTAPRAREVAAEVRALRAEAAGDARLERIVARLGGAAAVLECGTPSAGPFQRPLVAWTLGVHAPEVAFRIDPGAPGLVFVRRGPRGADLRLPAAPRYLPVAALGPWRVLAARCAGRRGPAAYAGAAARRGISAAARAARRP